MAVTVSGMFGNNKTYFADSPVVIDIDGLEWGNSVSSPFTIVRVEVVYDNKVVGDFRADTGGQTSISFDISSALRAIWSDFDFGKEVAAAQAAKDSTGTTGETAASGDDFDSNGVREYRPYSLIIHTEYLDSQDGEFTPSSSGVIPGGRCAIGGLTERERRGIGQKENADASHWNASNNRNGDASTKPSSSPERVGSQSITSWTDVDGGGTKSVFYPAGATPAADAATAHAPSVLRDSMPYTDFLFVNRRGAVETCSGQMLEAMDISVETQQYARVERPAFKPSRSLMAISNGERRSWSMSSGHQRREWAEWWAMEFLKARRWWMLCDGEYVPVIVEPAKKQTGIYDRSKQEMPSVEFTVTLALEG